jgi:putative oxidoreductase
MILGTIARFLLAIPFLVFGLMHFIQGEMVGSMVPEYMPGSSSIWVYVSGAIMVAGSVSIILRKFDYWAALVLSVLMIIYVVAVHLPNLSANNPIVASNILKDIAMAGGTLFYAHARSSSK